jgi:hypothetical protein
MAILRSGRGGDAISIRIKSGTTTGTACTHISAEVCIFGISPSCDRIGRSRRCALDDGEYSAKRIDVILEIGKGPVGAWLERQRVAAGSRVEGVDRGKHRVRVQARPPDRPCSLSHRRRRGSRTTTWECQKKFFIIGGSGDGPHET